MAGDGARGLLDADPRSVGAVDDAALDISLLVARHSLFSRLFDEPVAPVRLGRFTILERLGRGAMGTVYSAYDTRLDRKVAIKLLHPDRRDRARLLREAKSLARLSHPNVVGLFEIEASEDELFMVMEFVDGVTLADWLRVRPRMWSEVRDVLVDAGRGLAAAHGVGLVHRDFKPSNVLVDSQRRVRVADFGLARPIEDVEGEPSQPSRTDRSMRDAASTRSEGLVGTPAYMSPELFDGGLATDRSDQFAFCVVLYEALVGRRPFHGETVSEMLENMRQRAFSGWPREVRVPTFVRKVVERGLSATPEGRFASMDELVQALQRDPARKARRWIFVMGSVGGVILGAWWMAGPQRACVPEAEAIDEAWGRHKASLVAHFGQDAAHATSWARVEKNLDDYAQAWLVARVEACEAARTKVEPGLLTVRRMTCLDRRLEEMSALVGALVASEPEQARRHAVNATAALPPLATCSDAELLLGEPELPSAPEVVRAIQSIRHDIAQARALQTLGHYDAGRAMMQRADEIARELGYSPLVAEVRLQLGTLLCWSGWTHDAEPLLQDAVKLGLEHGMPLVAADGWNHLIWALVYPEPRYREAHIAADYAEALLAARPGQERMLATVRARRGRLYLMQSRLEEALVEQEAVLELRRSAFGDDDPDIGFSLQELGKTHKALGRWDEAREYLEAAAEHFARAIRPDHPQIAENLEELGNIFVLEGKHDDAVAVFEQALVHAERALGPEHEQVASLWNNLGLALIRMNRTEDAWAAFDLAEAVWTRKFGAEAHPMVHALEGKAEVRQVEGSYDQAEALYRRALGIVEANEGREASRYGRILAQLGHLMLAQSRWEEAVAHLEPALAVLGADDPDRALHATALAHARAALGHGSAAEGL